MTARPSGSAPGGIAMEVAKRVAERALWSRVRVQRLVERRGERPRPAAVPPTAVLSTQAQWRAAVRECKRLRLPLHRDLPKNWDALGAIATIVERFPAGGAVLDAGSARYSPVLPWLRLYGFTDLVGINLEFGADVRRDGVLFRHGDITASGFPDGRFDAVTCMSVIEHGVPVEAFLVECARILRPGGVLVISTDYDQQPDPAASSHQAYGQAVHIFSPDEVRELVATAARHGLSLDGTLDLEHAERPVHWRRTGLDYTFLRLGFVRDAPAAAASSSST